MPHGNLKSTEFVTPDDSGLPDWLAGSETLSDSGAPLLAGLLDLDLPLASDGSSLSSHSQRTPVPSESGETPRPAPAPSGPAPTPPPRTRSEKTVGADGWQFTQQDVPHNPADTPDVRSYRFHVSNTSQTGVFECAVEFALPVECRGVRANRSPKRTRTGLEWNLGPLAPGAGVWLSVRLPLTAQAAALKHAPASIRIATRCAVPMLAIAAEAPAQVDGGQPVPITVVFTNPGRVALKAGTVTVTGATGALAIEAAFPDIAAGSEHRAILALPPQPVGATRCRVTATAPDVPSARATVEFVTVLSALGAALTAPPRIDIDEEFTCQVKVTKPAVAPVGGVRVTLPVPEELVFRGASAGGTLSVAGDHVEWDINSIPQEGVWEATAKFAGFAPGRIRLRASISGTGVRGASADANLECAVRRGTGGTTLAEVLAGIALPAPAPDGPELATAVVRETGERHLVVRAGEARLAVPLASVRDVLRPLPVTALPGTPEWVAGVANVRGDIITVIDLAAFLDLGEAAPRRGLVIVQGTDGCLLGALVEEVTGIRAVTTDTDCPIDNRLSRFLTGVGTDANGTVHRLAVAELLTTLETELGEPVGSA